MGKSLGQWAVGAALFLTSSFPSAATGQEPVACYVVDTGAARQTIDCFGASDAWSMQELGLWPEAKCRQAADWLFSLETDAEGKPCGIGLSLWRFNVGAGSAGQGRASQINRGTRTECFLQADGTYDWSRQPGQRAFLRMAKERGVPYFLAFLNSPPVYFTQNGLATNTGRGGTFNLREDCYDDFARFLGEVVEGLEREEGIRFDYLCPVNEPDGHWNWTGPKQEGTPATQREIARAVRLISAEFLRRGLPTKILVNESSDYRCMMGEHMAGWQRGYAIRSFFCPDSAETYVGNLPNVPHLMAGHSYWTNTPLEALRGYRCALRDSMGKYGVDFWQTETCIMGNDEEIGGGGGFDSTMKTALYVARIVHHDLVCADARSWQWWRAAGGDYKDGLLYMRAEPGDAKDGYLQDSKLLWALGNYSRFVRPGAVRYAVRAEGADGRVVPEGETDPRGVMCSAYRNRSGQWVLVVLNYSEAEKPFRFSLSGASGRKTWRLYRTSDRPGESLAPAGTLENGEAAALPPRSITTFVTEN